MNNISLYKLLIFVSFLILSTVCFSQARTFKGQVIDATTKEGVFRATVSYSVEGFAQGVTSDDEGHFEITVPQGIDSLRVSHISFNPTMKSIKFVKTKSIKIALNPHASQIKEVIITAKKEKYSNKNNPAVDLIKKVLENRDENSILNYCPLNYLSHNKTLIALDPVNDTVLSRMKLKPVLNLMTGLEPTYFDSENYLPMYFFEELAQMYCKNGKNIDQQMLALQDIKLTAILDENDAKRIKSSIFTKINLYQKYVDVLGYQFMSPINPLAPQFYKFFIEDTLIIDNRECIKLSFLTRNLYDMGFMGDLFIANDSTAELISAKLTIPEKANVNFVDRIEFVQKYKTDSFELEGVKKQISYVVEDAIYAKINFYSLKAYGYSINTYSKPKFEEYVLKETKELKNFILTDSNRLSVLTQAERKTYQLPDSLNTITWFRVAKYLSEIFYGGYLLAGPFDIGPLDNLYSFNKIEGSRLRFSGKTNYKLSKSFYLNWMVAYGTKDKKMKYDFDLKYSFNSLTKNPYSFPANFIGIQYTYNTFIPGRTLENSNYDRLSLSITDIVNYKLAFNKAISIQWFYETKKAITINPYLKFQEIKAYGDWNFANLLGSEIASFRKDRAGINLKILFNGSWVQNQNKRMAIGGNYTSLNINYEYGFDNTHLLKANAYRKLNLVPFGYMLFWAEGGYIWGKMLSPYVFTPSTYNSVIYHQNAFNLMKVMEFFSDRYVQLIAIYNLNGLIFNRIPLVRELKLREEFNIKMVYGGLREENRFMIDGLNAQTFTDKPYVEAGFGFQNLFQILGVEYIRRITYTEGLPENRKWGIRANLLFRF
ncbi:MAG: DUF5686 family protein [Bacteroidales bacterium]